MVISILLSSVQIFGVSRSEQRGARNGSGAGVTALDIRKHPDGEGPFGC